VETIFVYGLKILYIVYLNYFTENVMTQLEKIYHSHLNTPSDINEHLPTLMKYSLECNHVIEMGVRVPCSTYALMMGKPKIMKSYDITPLEFFGVNRKDVAEVAKEHGIDWEFIQANVLHIDIDETDFLFIDTYHTYYQLKDELRLHSNKVKKYLGFHDTTTFADIGEGGVKGLWPAIVEFLEENKDWVLDNRYENNNGLTILKRISHS